MKKTIFWLLLLILATSLMACSTQVEPTGQTTVEPAPTSCATAPPTEATTEPAGPQDLSPLAIGQLWLADGLDPLSAFNGKALVSHGVAERVYMQAADGDLQSRFIESLEQVDDYNWLAVVKQGVQFADGSAVDSQALCAALNRIAERHSAPAGGQMSFAPTAQYGFSIKTEQPTKLLPAILAAPHNVVFKTLPDGEFLFTGPYVVTAFEPGVALDLTPNPHYPTADWRVALRIAKFADATALEAAFQAGQLDLAFGLTPSLAVELEQSGAIVKQIESELQYLALIKFGGFMKDYKLREALNIGLDRTAYRQLLLGGVVPKGLFAEHYGFNGDAPLQIDPELAGKLLDRAGYELKFGERRLRGRLLKLRIICDGRQPELVVIMELMVEQLAELGVLTQTAVVDDMAAELKRAKYDIALCAMATAPQGDPVGFLSDYFATAGVNNHSAYSSAELDALLTDMANLPFGDSLNDAVKAAQQVIVDDVAAMPLLSPQLYLANSPRLADYLPYWHDNYIVNPELLTK